MGLQNKKKTSFWSSFLTLNMWENNRAKQTLKSLKQCQWTLFSVFIVDIESEVVFS